MNGKFFDLKKEKQDRMINAALKTFALHGYRHASTDDIVREASISKGLLFHYFESKLGVYSFIYDYSVRYTILELRSTIDRKEQDLFEIMRQTERARLQAMRDTLVCSCFWTAPCPRMSARRCLRWRKSEKPWRRHIRRWKTGLTIVFCPGMWTEKSSGECWLLPSGD